jgi:GNAT superfamily N-acetyltransferase
MELRDATLEDATTIAEVHRESWAAMLRGLIPESLLDEITPEERLSRWRAWLTDPDALTMVWESGGCIVGFCTVCSSRDDDADSTRVADMPTLYVLPSHWRHGIGRALCEAAIGRARDRGFHELTLWTLEANRNARLFYATMGFAPDGATKMDNDGPIRADLVGMRLRMKLTPDGGGA